MRPSTDLPPLGHVSSITGSYANVQLTPPAPSDGFRVTVGKFLALQTGKSAVVAVITEADGDKGRGDGKLTVCVDLLGEIKYPDKGPAFFQRGITEYPVVGDRVDALGSDAMRIVYDTGGAHTISIGRLQQDSTIPAHIKVDEMLRKHFAFFGGTGAGKSSGVVVILREILASKPNQRIFLIDPHNEYGRSFRDCAVVLNPKNLTLPFWLFNFEETVDVFFRGRPGLEEEVEVLAQVIPLAKSLFASTRGGEGQTLRKIDPSGTSFTSTRPCPTACPTWSA